LKIHQRIVIPKRGIVADEAGLGMTRDGVVFVHAAPLPTNVHVLLMNASLVEC
jgi:hypothetical protein